MTIRKRRWIGFLTVGAAALAQEALAKVSPPRAGKVDADRNQSTPDWPQQVKAKAGSPNIVLVRLDDVGFAATFVTGGPVKAPELEKLASEGLRYRSFHVNALCSPTRAALLSGRTSHQAGVRRRGRRRDRLSRLKCAVAQMRRLGGLGAEGQWLQHRRFRQVAQYARLGNRADRTLRSLSDVARLRIFLWLLRRRRQPVGAASVPQHARGGAHGDASFRLSSDHRSGQ